MALSMCPWDRVLWFKSMLNHCEAISPEAMLSIRLTRISTSIRQKERGLLTLPSWSLLAGREHWRD